MSAGSMPATPFAKIAAKHFGEELRRARLKAGLTQQALAERASIDPVFVSFLENGHRQPSLAVILSIERAVSVAHGALVRRVGKHFDPTARKKTAVARRKKPT
jgi:transcriptional regulator with XRE-family HTH domain